MKGHPLPDGISHRKSPSNRKALVAKAGKRRAPHVDPPTGTTRRDIIDRTAAWAEANKAKARTGKSADNEVGSIRWDLARAQRLTFHTAKGNESA